MFVKRRILLLLAIIIVALALASPSARACRGGDFSQTFLAFVAWLTRSPPSDPAKALFAQAQALDRSGQTVEAVVHYRRAARAGHGPAAKILGDIYDRGKSEVARDYSESLMWYQTARDLGEDVPLACR